MAAWWESLNGILRILYCIAIPATIIFLIQTILTMAGGLGDGGADLDVSDTSGLDMPHMDAPDMAALDLPDTMGELSGTDAMHTDGHPHDASDAAVFRLLSLQTIVAFFTVFGWSSIAAISSGSNETVSIAVGLVTGFIAMFLVAKLVQVSQRLAENGTLNLRNALGESARVYLPIPANGAGEGKVMLQVQNQLNEFSAMTLGANALQTGTIVRVTDVRGDVLVVEQE